MAGEMASLAAALAWGFATVWFTLALKKGGKAAEAVFFKNFFGALFLGIVAFFLGSTQGGGAVGSGNLSWLLASGFIGLALGDLFYFTALAHIGVGRTLILTQVTPVATAILAWMFLDETLTTQQWLGAFLVVFGGILSESRQPSRTAGDKLGFLAAIGCIVVFSIGNVLTHHGMTDTGMVTAAAWRLGAGAAGVLLLASLRKKGWEMLKSSIQPHTRKFFLLPSALGTWLGLTLLMGGFKYAKQGVAASLVATTPLVSIPLAVIFLKEKPGWRGWVGAFFVLLGVIVMTQ